MYVDQYSILACSPNQTAQLSALGCIRLNLDVPKLMLCASKQVFIIVQRIYSQFRIEKAELLWVGVRHPSQGALKMILDHVHEDHSLHYQFKAFRIGAYKFIHFLPTLEEYECRHLINPSVKKPIDPN